MTNLVAVVGSLRKESVNRAVARAALAVVPEGVTLTMLDLADVPLYNGDIEEAGLPPSVQAVHDAVGAADGLIFFSPEYNGSFPAVTKNVIDWMTRPPKSWEGTAITMVTASPGPRAGLGVRTHFEAIMEHQPVQVFPSLGIGEYSSKLDATGAVTNEATLAEIATHLANFASFAAA